MLSKINRCRSSSIKSTSAKWGPFHFEKSRGELEPQQVDTLSIRCSSDSIGHFQEKLAIVVPDCLPVDENRSISLIADVCVAQIDFNNYNEMFAESHILNSLGDSYCPYQVIISYFSINYYKMINNIFNNKFRP